VGGEGLGELRIELVDELINEVEGLHSLRVHLLLDLVEDLIGLVPPVHRSYNSEIIYYLSMEGDLSISEFHEEEEEPID
jgi:hypothetical protein